MVHAGSVGFIAWLVPFTGILTMLSTEFLACTNHFKCTEDYPTLSYAATFRPEGYVFTGGMSLTAIFIFMSSTLFFWYLHLLIHKKKLSRDSNTRQSILAYGCLTAGLATSISLFGLAVKDMRFHHQAHTNFTITFFISAWALIITMQVARTIILHENEKENLDGKLSSSENLVVVLRRRSFWLSLRRWKELDCFTAYILGRLMLTIGIASTFLFSVCFLCVNSVLPNPLGLTAIQEAFFEALAIVCQLLYMGTLSCELARLVRLVQHSDDMVLETCRVLI